jgi:phenylacetate-CoA ligase
LSWYTRDTLPAAVEGAGLLLTANPGEAALALSREARDELLERSRSTLAAVGIAAGDRAVLSLAGEGDLAGPLLAEAFMLQGASAALLGPRGRLRLLASIRELKPRVWVTTPGGALDFLARLYLEFNVDPMELGIEQIIVVGEIASPGTFRRLADEFESEVTGLYCDPFYGCALAHASGGKWRVGHPDVLSAASLVADETIERDVSQREGAPVELVVKPLWSMSLGDSLLRTGQVVSESGEPSGLFQHTVGQHVLARGRWLSLPLLRRALSVIDGTAAWRLHVTRGDGTLDKVTLTLGFDRDSLLDNKMWAARAREAVSSTTPIAFELLSDRAADGAPAEEVVDDRGHHLGTDRAAVGGVTS